MATVKTGQINVPYQSRNSFNYVSQVVKTNDYQSKTGEKNPQFWQTVRGGYYAGNVGISDEQRFDSGTFVQTGQNTITVNAVKGHDIAVEFFVNKNIDSVSSYGFNGCSTREKGVLRGTNEIVSSEIDNNVWYAIISTQEATGYTIGESIKVLSMTAGGVGMTVYAIFLAESTSYDSSVYPVDDTSWNSVPADPYISRDDRITITLTVDSQYGEWTDGVVSYSGYFVEVSASEAVKDPINIYANATDSQGIFHSGLHYTMNKGDTVSKAFYRKEDWVQAQLVSGTVRIEILDDNALYEVVNNLNGFNIIKSQTGSSYEGGKLTPIVVDTSLPGETWDDGSTDPSTYDNFDDWYESNLDISTNYGEDDNTKEEDNIIGYSTQYIYQFLNNIYGNGWSIDSSGNAKFNTITVADGGLNIDLDEYSTIAYSDLMDASLKRYIDEQIENIDITVDVSDGSIDLSRYATKTYVDNKETDLRSYIDAQDSSLQNYVDEIIQSISTPDLSGYATKQYVDGQDSSIVTWAKNHTVLLTQDEYDQLEEIDPEKIYFIQDGGGSDSGSIDDTSIINYVNNNFVKNNDISVYSTINYVDQQDVSIINYVNNQISNINLYIDQQDSLLKNYVDSSINRLQSLIENSYATRQWVTQQLIDWDSSSQIDLSDYATKMYSDTGDSSIIDYVDEALEGYATMQYSDEQDVSIINLMILQDTSIKTYVDSYKTQNDQKISNIEAILDNEQIIVCTEAEYQELEDSSLIDENKIYLIKEAL